MSQALNDYNKFSTTGTIHPDDVFDVQQYRSMGHRVREDDIEYSKVRLMEIWHGNRATKQGDGLNGLYPIGEVVDKPMGEIKLLLDGLNYCYLSESDYDNSIFTFGVLGVDAMKSFFERFYELSTGHDIEGMFEAYVEDELREQLEGRRDMLDVLEDENVPMTTKIELLQSIEDIPDKLILGLCSGNYAEITINDEVFGVVFVDSLSEFSHGYYSSPDSSVLVYDGISYGSFIVDYMNEFSNHYGMNVYKDCVTETLLDNGDLVIEWSEPIPRVLASEVPVFEIPMDIFDEHDTLHIKLSSDIPKKQLAERKHYVGMKEGDVLSSVEKADILTWFASSCKKIIIHK